LTFSTFGRKSPDHKKLATVQYIMYLKYSKTDGQTEEEVEVVEEEDPRSVAWELF